MWIHLPGWAVWGLVALLSVGAGACLRRLSRRERGARKGVQAHGYRDVEEEGPGEQDISG